MIGPGTLVRCLDRDGVWHEGIADGPPENGEVRVRFTTRGREQPWPAGKVEEVGPPW